MNNPFKAGDKVSTKVKGQPVEATVNQVWNEEVQVRTDDKKLLWRTVKTVTLVEAAPVGTSPAKPVESPKADTPAAETLKPGPQVPDTAPSKDKGKKSKKYPRIRSLFKRTKKI